MTITNRDGVIAGLASGADRLIIDKASLSNQIAGRYASLWRATGQPAQAAIPTTAAVCTSALLGASAFSNQTAPTTSYVGWMFAVCSNSSTSVEIQDRLAHIGGFVLNVTTAQTVSGMNLASLSIPNDRLGSSNYSDVQWWLEVYTDGGATASNATINVTYDDDTTGNLNVQTVGGTVRVGMMFALTPLIPTAKQGKFIKGINTVTLSASTGTAGNFGFTATRPRTTLPLPLANKQEVFDWAALGLPEIPNDACVMYVVLPSNTFTGTVRGGGKLIHG